MTRPLVFDLSLPELVALLESWGEPAFRARQVWKHVYAHSAPSAADLTDLPPALRRRLDDELDFVGLLPVAESASSDGETSKTLFALPDGAEVEAVLMRYERRRTICISTQVGCAMGCVFCATGQMGILRNLTTGEIVAQVMAYARRLQAAGEHLTNIVVMGMGEPFHNYDATLAALDRLNHPEGFGFGERRMTISTVGLVPAIGRFAAERRQINLAVSLHAATDELRSTLLPVNRRYPLAVLFDACRQYVEVTHRRLTFEWALIHGVNDGLDQAEALGRLAGGMNCHVNLIPLNPTRAYAGGATPRRTADAFAEALRAQGIPATVRIRRGIDIQAGCGQLASRAAPPDGSPALQRG